MSALFNGRPERGAWTTSRGLHYGDGVFRTMLALDGKIVDERRQFETLVSDAVRMDLAAAAARACRADARTLASREDRAAIKCLLWREGAQRGYRPTTSSASRLVISGPLPSRPARNWSRGIAAIRSDVTLHDQPLLAGIKHLGRQAEILASKNWPRGVDEAILCDASRRPIGGTRSNLFWIRQGRLYTPQLTACGVAGVMRQKVLETAQALGMRWQIGPWTWSDLEMSDEAFITNSLIGIWPLRRCGGLAWSAPGAHTRELMRSIQHPLVPA